MHLRTGTNALLTDSLSNKPIVVTLVPNQPGSLEFVTNNFNTLTDTRNITIQGFDERDPNVQAYVAAEATRAFALSFAGDHEIQSRVPSEASYFSQFRMLSGWTTDPDSFEEYSLSGDGSEFYLNDANFVPELLATFNSKQDFASVWAAVLNPDVNTAEFTLKALNINRLFDLLRP